MGGVSGSCLGTPRRGMDQNRMGVCVCVPQAALGANWNREDTIPPLYKAELGCTLNHVTWAGDLVLISTSAGILTRIAAELIMALEEASFRTKWVKARYMSL